MTNIRQLGGQKSNRLFISSFKKKKYAKNRCSERWLIQFLCNNWVEILFLLRGYFCFIWI